MGTSVDSLLLADPRARGPVRFPVSSACTQTPSSWIDFGHADLPETHGLLLPRIRNQVELVRVGLAIGMLAFPGRRSAVPSLHSLGVLVGSALMQDQLGRPSLAVRDKRNLCVDDLDEKIMVAFGEYFDRSLPG